MGVTTTNGLRANFGGAAQRSRALRTIDRAATMIANLGAATDDDGDQQAVTDAQEFLREARTAIEDVGAIDDE